MQKSNLRPENAAAAMDNCFLSGDPDAEIMGRAFPNAVRFAVHQKISKSNRKDLIFVAFMENVRD